MLRNRRKKIIAEAEAEAEVIKKEKILQAKESFCSSRQNMKR
jgi:hypothetical protein